MIAFFTASAKIGEQIKKTNASKEAKVKKESRSRRDDSTYDEDKSQE
jgi:hypothetical protein